MRFYFKLSYLFNLSSVQPDDIADRVIPIIGPNPHALSISLQPGITILQLSQYTE